MLRDFNFCPQAAFQMVKTPLAVEVTTCVSPARTPTAMTQVKWASVCKALQEEVLQMMAALNPDEARQVRDANAGRLVVAACDHPVAATEDAGAAEAVRVTLQRAHDVSRGRVPLRRPRVQAPGQ